VVAGVSERLYGKLYRDALGLCGIDMSMVEFANITDHCVAAHRNCRVEAMACSKKLIGFALAKVLKAVPREKLEAEVKPSCVVIGGGVAGMSAAAALSTRGIKVTIVDKHVSLGGLLNRLNVLFPAYVPASDFVEQQRRQLAGGDIDILTGAEPVSLTGQVGDYSIELSDGGHLEAGTIIVATGAGLLNPEGLYGYGQIDGVITQMDLEALLARNEDPGSDIVMIQCAGSRIPERPYCSRICCTASIKNTIVVKQKHPSANITILSRGFAEYAGDLDKAREMGVEIIRYSPERPPVVDAGTVTVYDEISEMETRIPFDRVVLAVPMVPSEGTERLAKVFKIPADEYGFLVEPHLKIRPEEFAPRGVFIAGCAHWPATMTESIVQGYGAATRAFELISAGRIERYSHVADVDPELCRGCAKCEDVCRHGAIALECGEDGMKEARVIRIHCTGCGVCTAVCPSGAISLGDMSLEQTDLVVDAIGGVRD
jgi:heterodisulfide reductase subunit A